MGVSYDKDIYIKAIDVLEQEVLLGGRNVSDCYAESGISESMLNRLREFYFNARQDRTGRNVELYRKNKVGTALVNAVYERLGKKVPKEFEDLQSAREIAKSESMKAAWTEERKKEQRERIASAYANTKDRNESVASCPVWEQQKLMLLRKIDERLAMLTEDKTTFAMLALLTEFVNVLIPTAKEDIMKQMNANADSIGLQISDCVKYLDNIRGNTKRKGYQG